MNCANFQLYVLLKSCLTMSPTKLQMWCASAASMLDQLIAFRNTGKPLLKNDSLMDKCIEFLDSVLWCYRLPSYVMVSPNGCKLRATVITIVHELRDQTRGSNTKTCFDICKKSTNEEYSIESVKVVGWTPDHSRKKRVHA